MIQRTDILSMGYLKKTEFTGCYRGMRYRLESAEVDGDKQLKVTIWPEPFNFFKTPEDEKQYAFFTFDEDGVNDGIAWMNDRWFEDKDKWESASSNWSSYRL